MNSNDTKTTWHMLCIYQDGTSEVVESTTRPGGSSKVFKADGTPGYIAMYTADKGEAEAFLRHARASK